MWRVSVNGRDVHGAERWLIAVMFVPVLVVLWLGIAVVWIAVLALWALAIPCVLIGAALAAIARRHPESPPLPRPPLSAREVERRWQRIEEELSDE